MTSFQVHTLADRIRDGHCPVGQRAPAHHLAVLTRWQQRIKNRNVLRWLYFPRTAPNPCATVGYVVPSTVQDPCSCVAVSLSRRGSAASFALTFHVGVSGRASHMLATANYGGERKPIRVELFPSKLHIPPFTKDSWQRSWRSSGFVGGFSTLSK